MARKPKVDLGAIIQPENANGIPTPETQPEPTSQGMPHGSHTADSPPAPKTRTYPSREGKSSVQFFLNKDAHRQLKIVSAETDKSHQDILIEALNAWFLMNDKPPIA